MKSKENELLSFAVQFFVLSMVSCVVAVVVFI